MPFDQIELPALQRAASVRPESINREERTIEIVWTTGATVQRVRWEGWDDRVEYDETLEVSEHAVRLERMNAGAPFLNSHRSWGGLGAVLGTVVRGSVRIESGKGYATIRLTEAEDVASLIQRILEGTVHSVSVGYQVYRYEITKTDGEREQWRAVDWEPLEVSAVAIPADPGAQVRAEPGYEPALAPCVVIRHAANAATPAASAMRSDMPNEKKAGAGDAGTPQAETDTIETRAADPAAPANPAPAPKAQPSAPAAPDANAIRAEERERISQIHGLARRHELGDEFADDLVTRGVSLPDARAAILDELAEADGRGARSAEPGVAFPRAGLDAEVTYRDALTEALMHRHSPGVHKLPDRAREYRGMSLIEIAKDALGRSGVRARGMSKMEVAGAALSMRSGAGYHSTSDFPAILANVANKALRSAYESTPRTFAAWARRSTITDFKPVSRTQLGGAPDLQKVLESGEFTYGTMGEGKEVYALATYGRIISITRQAIINDDLDAFTRVPAAFGAAAADLESDIVYGILSDNPAMADGEDLFSAAHENQGTASVINEAALAEAWRLFGQKKGIEERLISILPRFILVPPGQRSVEARKQVTSTTPNGTADVNTFAGRLEVVEEPRLIPAALPDPWFLAADPARIDTVEYAYLEGQEGVYTETRMGFEVDGIEIKARHDFASKAIDFRGLFKNAGANPA
tara:strand:+ start:13129 stop:15216 length:2088 start_codon:yes stop_codon:yes gene_type:complete